MKSNRAYSVMQIKSVDEDKRILEGIASTPTPDRMNDVVVPEGMQFSVPFPFLYQHNSRQPIGQVVEAKVSKDGLRVRVQLAKPGVAEFIDEAWALIKEGLVRGLSIGFRSLEESWDKTLNGYKFLRTEIMELSAVTIPANAEASITAIKSASLEARAAFGNERSGQMRSHQKTHGPGAPGYLFKGNSMKTISEQIAAFEARRQANVARQESIRGKSAEEGRTMDESEAEEFDGLTSENETIDKELARLRRHEKMLDTATPITRETGESQATGTSARGGVVRVQGVRANVPPGTAFVRLAMALMAAKGDRMDAFDMVRGQKSWKDSTPQVEKFLGNPNSMRIAKEAVAAGTTTADGWATELADYSYMASEFIEYLRPQTIIGKLPLRKVPFNIRIPVQDLGSSVNWVGEGLAKPVTKLHFDTATFRFAKAAGIVIMTDELVRFSNPAAEDVVRGDLSATIRQFLDEQFVDPSVAVVANVSPASITNGSTTTAASGTTAEDFRNDLKLALAAMIAANIDPAGVYILMQSTLAVSLSLMRNDLGQKEFPEITASGGRIEGYEVVTSQSVSSGVVVFLQPREIMLADDGGVTLDASREASVVMDDGVSPASTTMVSLWQNNMVGLRVERIVNWGKRRAAAVYYITAADYGAASPA